MSLLLLGLLLLAGPLVDDDLAAEVEDLLRFTASTFDDEFSYTHPQNDTWIIESSGIEATAYLLSSLVDMEIPTEIKGGRFLIHAREMEAV